MEKGKINSITIEGVKGEGDYNYDLSDNKWDLSNSTASYTVSFTGDEGKVVGKRALTGGENDKKVLMMIPQTLSDGAKVTIYFTPTGKSATKASFRLGGTTWEPGSHVTYLLSTTKIIKLNMGSVTYPQWQTAEGSPFTSKNLKSDYASGDALGMYIVDKNHKVVKANVQLTTTDGKNWKFPSPQEFIGSLSYDYFLYYPYQADGLAGAPKEGDAVSVNSGTNQISASDFFSGAITKWGESLKTDQGDDGKFNSCDLQIGKGELAESSSTVAFPTMTHAMGLAVLNRESKSVPKHYILSGYPSYTWDNGTTTLIPSATLSNSQKLYATTSTQGVKVIPPSAASTFSSTSRGEDAWSGDVKITAAANGVGTGTAKIKATKVDSTYIMAVGDIYYSDGAITKPEDISAARTNGKTPIGIIGYLGSDYWTEKGVSGKGGHALVMCLKTIGSTGSTKAAQDDYNKYKSVSRPIVQAYVGKIYAWWYSSSNNSDAGLTKVTSRDLLVKSCNETYGSGYAETDTLIQKWGSDAAAAYQAKNYNTLPANSTKCTGWFLPTAGQYYAAMSQLGGGIRPDTWEIGTFFGNMKDVTTKINNNLKKMGDSNYTEFFGDINTWVWTSSEVSSGGAVCVDSGVDDSKGSGSVRFSNFGKTDQRPVRPFLAF